MTTQTKLLVYLRKLGFDIDFQPDKTVCTDGPNIIVMKRGKLLDRHYQAIMIQLGQQGYDVSSFVDDFLPTKTDKLKKKEMIAILQPFIDFTNVRLDPERSEYANDDNHTVYAYNHMALKIGDFRKLRELYEKLK
jgi:hypothetical protein